MAAVAAGSAFVRRMLEDDRIARMDGAHKLEEALHRAANIFPGSVAAKLDSLITPETIAVLVVWAASLAVGVGEVVDGALILGGLITLGRDAFQVFSDLKQAIAGALSAQTDKQMDQAAVALSRAIEVAGTDALFALVARRIGARSESPGTVAEGRALPEGSSIDATRELRPADVAASETTIPEGALEANQSRTPETSAEIWNAEGVRAASQYLRGLGHSTFDWRANPRIVRRRNRSPRDRGKCRLWSSLLQRADGESSRTLSDAYPRIPGKRP